MLVPLLTEVSDKSHLLKGNQEVFACLENLILFSRKTEAI